MKYKIRTSPQKRETNLQKILNKKKMTQKHLAKLADLEVYQVSKLCTGLQTDFLISTAKKICNTLDVTLDEAFGD